MEESLLSLPSLHPELIDVVIKLTYTEYPISTYSLLLVSTHVNKIISKLLSDQMLAIRSVFGLKTDIVLPIGNGEFVIDDYSSFPIYELTFPSWSFRWSQSIIHRFKYNYAGIEHDVLPAIYSYAKKLLGNLIDMNLCNYDYCSCYECNNNNVIVRRSIPSTPIIHSVAKMDHAMDPDLYTKYIVKFQVFYLNGTIHTGEVEYGDESDWFGCIKNIDGRRDEYPPFSSYISGNYQWLMKQKIKELG